MWCQKLSLAWPHFVAVREQLAPRGSLPADTTPLVGMRLLDGHSLYVEVEDGGRVVIEPKARG